MYAPTSHAASCAAAGQLKSSSIPSFYAQFSPLIRENLPVFSIKTSSDTDSYPLPFSLGSYYLLIRYSVHCRWDPSHRIPKWLIMISRVSSSTLGCCILRSFLCHLSLQACLLVSAWVPGLHNAHEKISELQPLHTTNTLSNTQISYHPCSRHSFKNQQILCFLFFSQPILKHALCFSSLQSSFFFQNSFFGKRLAYFCCYKGLTYFSLSEVQLASRTLHGYH